MATVSGSGGAKTITVSPGDQLKVTNFGAFGTGAAPASPAELDTLQFLGAGMTAQNLILTQSGSSVFITFDGVPNTLVRLVDVTIEQLENIVGAGNFRFVGEGSVTESVDVWSAAQTGSGVAQANGVTVLNDLANTVSGKDASADTINGQGGDDILAGLGGNDVLRGGDGNDQLNGGTGADRMTGGSGNDTYIVDDAGDVVVETNGTGGTDTVQSAITYALAENLENLTLTGHVATNGTGNGLANVINGNDAANTISGGNGDDALEGNSGNDTVLGGAGNDSLRGGVGVDHLDGGTGIDVMNGGRGDDTYIVDSVDDQALETVGLASGGGTDTVVSAVSFTLGANLDNLQLADDLDINGTGNELANVMSGGNRTNALFGLAGDDTLLGNNGNDTLDGGIGNDVLQGGSGVDVLVGNKGADAMVGGLGDDTYYVDDLGDSVTETNTLAQGGGLDQVLSSVSFALGANLEHLALIGAAAIDGTGNALANSINGNTGANKLAGAAGNDTLVGADGDTLLGEADNDTLILQTDGIALADGGDGIDTLKLDAVKGDVDLTTTLAGKLTNIEVVDLSFNGAGLDQNLIVDVASINAANGASGAFGAKTMLVKGEATDRLTFDDSGWILSNTTTNPFGQVGGYNIFVNGDTTLYVESEVAVTGAESFAIVLIGDESDNYFSGADGDDHLIGNARNDTLLGGAGNDLLEGGVGDDTLDGGPGNDVMNGGRGDDIYTVDSLGDKVLETVRGGGFDQVTSSVDFTMGPNIETLTLTGSAIVGVGNDQSNDITGNDQDNLINGGASDDLLAGIGGNDTLHGDSGDDVLDGGPGADAMIGGSGGDVYWVDNIGDTVTEGVNQGVDEVASWMDYTLGANLENLALVGNANITGTGNDFDNSIYGNQGASTLNGGAGNDFIQDGFFGPGNTLHGDAGNDTLVVQFAATKADGGDGTDTLRLEWMKGDLDLTSTLSGKFANIDIVQLDSNGNAQNLIVDAAAVSAVNGASGSFGAKTLLVNGESADSVTFDDAGWTLADTVSDPFGQTGSYGKYVNGDTTLYVEDEVAVIGIV